MFLWCMLILGATSSDTEIPLDRAEQSSTYLNYIASNAIDNDDQTFSLTNPGYPIWLRLYFQSSSTVEKVVIEKGHSDRAACVITVSVYAGDTETVCGTYTGKPYA